MKADPALSTPEGKETFKALRRVAMKEGINPQSVSIRFALERMLDKMFSSPHADRLVLKGGTIMMYAEETDPLHARATEDIDLHIPDFEGTIEEFQDMMHEILSTTTERDQGIKFDLDMLKVVKTRDGAVPGGSLKVPAQIGDMRVSIKCDVGFDRRPAHDVSISEEMPSVLPGGTPINVRRVPFSWMVADKIQAGYKHGAISTRLKDFYDLYVILSRDKADFEETAKALAMTFELFGTDFPESVDQLSAYSDTYAREKAEQWKKETRERRFVVETPEFPEVVAFIRSKVNPLLARARQLHAEGPVLPGSGSRAAKLDLPNGVKTFTVGTTEVKMSAVAIADVDDPHGVSEWRVQFAGAPMIKVKRFANGTIAINGGRRDGMDLMEEIQAYVNERLQLRGRMDMDLDTAPTPGMR